MRKLIKSVTAAAAIAFSVVGCASAQAQSFSYGDLGYMHGWTSGNQTHYSGLYGDGTTSSIGGTNLSHFSGHDSSGGSISLHGLTTGNWTRYSGFDSHGNLISTTVYHPNNDNADDAPHSNTNSNSKPAYGYNPDIRTSVRIDDTIIDTPTKPRELFSDPFGNDPFAAPVRYGQRRGNGR